MRHWITESNFSSHLIEARRPDRPADLTIKLRVYLAPMDPTKPYARKHPGMGLKFGPLNFATPDEYNLNFHTHLADSEQNVRRGLVQDANSHSFHARSWTRGEFEHFKQRFKHAVELVWNNRIILLPPDDPKEGLDDATYMRFVGDPKVPANVVCSLRIQLADDPDDNANAFMQVVRLDREVIPYRHPRFRPYHTLICNEDVYPFESSDHKRWQFVRTSAINAAHEVGHWLGRPIAPSNTDQILRHIDADTDKTPHDKMQYGATLGHYQGIMGSGSVATDYEARPWMTRAERHTGVLFGWQFIHRVHFPGNVAVPERQRRLAGGVASP